MSTTITRTPRRKASWRPARRVLDWAFRVTIPGRHYNLETAA